jgi:glutamate-1-semialdehyde aminotransferase
MRAITGRDLILKIEGSYHGHHDAVMARIRWMASIVASVPEFVYRHKGSPKRRWTPST